jgi:BolA protein
VLIESQAFAGAAKVARQRMVYRALAEELAGPLHALSIKALAPGES